MPDYEILEFFTSKGKTSPLSGCLETHTREGVNGCWVYSWELLVSRKQAECTDRETSWSLLESHSFWQRCLWSPILTSLPFASQRNALTTSPLLFFPVSLLFLWVTQVCKAMRRGSSQTPQVSCRGCSLEVTPPKMLDKRFVVCRRSHAQEVWAGCEWFLFSVLCSTLL